MTSALLEMRGISKRFGPTQALENVSLSVYEGEVLSLIGENGAGKSTLLRVLSGAHRADSGTMSIAGKSFHPKGPHDARQSGVAMIYQELNLAPDLSVEDNILLGHRGTGRKAWVSFTSVTSWRKSVRSQTRTACFAMDWASARGASPM